MRSFYIINRRASAVHGATTNGSAPNQSARRARLRFRDMVWAFHSESQELLLSASTAACDGKMTWSDAKALGISLWLNSSEKLVSSPRSHSRNIFLFCFTFYRKRNLRLLHGTSIWLGITVTRQRAPFSTLHWVSRN